MTNATTGTGTREARDLDLPIMSFDLQREVERLRLEPTWTEHGRSTKTLAKAPAFRVVLSLVHAGTEIGEDGAWAPLGVLVLSARATGRRDDTAIELPPGRLAWFGQGARWTVAAEEDSVLLLNLSWPGETAGQTGV